MLKLMMTLFKKEMIQRVLVYTGFVSLVLFWPITNIVLKNASFRIIGNWPYIASIILLVVFFAFPVILLVILEYLLSRKNVRYAPYFRYLLFLVGAVILWTQLVDYHLNLIIKGTGLFSNSFRYYSLLAGGLLFILITFKLRKYLSTFLMYVSVLFFIATGSLLFQTFQENIFDVTTPRDSLDSFSSATSKLKKPTYLLIFDGISLTSLLDGNQINEELFPTFSRLSREWTWYRNAITNATSTIPARSMIFSGQYWKSKISITGPKNNLFQELSPFVKTYFYLTPPSILDSDEKEPSKKLIDSFSGSSFRNAVALNKALFVAYLEVSVPSPLRKYINSTPLKYWRFDWRGKVPPEYRSKKHLYHGERFKKQFFNFLKDSTDPTKAGGSFYVLWSMISHFPYIFDERGNIVDSNYHTFEVNMDKEAIQKTYQNYIKVLQYNDYLIGVFIEQLKAKGLYEDSVIILISDHGMSKTGSNYNISDQVTRIPFFLKAPGLRKGANDRDAQIIDITPTILDILGLPLSQDYDGQSFLRSYQERNKVIYALGRGGFWVLQEDGTWKHQW